MLNTYTKINNNLKINACSGGIYKTYKESWFKRFHLKSKYADELFNKHSSIIVLQMVICGEMEVMAELIEQKDFNKILENTIDE